jgi:hypothetical protein
VNAWPADHAAWTFVLVLSAAGLAMKLWRAGETLVPAALPAAWRADPDALAQAPRRYHAQKDYAVPGAAPLLSDLPLYQLPPDRRPDVRTVRLPIGTGEWFGVAQPLAVAGGPNGSWVQTDVVAFPWNQMLLDGQPAPPEQVRAASDQLTVFVPPGEHTLGYRPVPDRVWLVLRRVSLAGFGLWTAVVLSVGLAAASRRPDGRHGDARL